MKGPKVQGITPSQTVGPFFKYGLTPDGKYDWNDAFTNDLVTPDASGDRIRVEGRVFDGDGQPVPDCMLEVWQADAQMAERRRIAYLSAHLHPPRRGLQSPSLGHHGVRLRDRCGR